MYNTSMYTAMKRDSGIACGDSPITKLNLPSDEPNGTLNVQVRQIDRTINPLATNAMTG